ncbi:hypothetical protein GCM10020331_062630 [Ectobacillus funiculus]
MKNAKKAVLDAINGWDPTDGAVYYFNPETATSKWIWGRPQIKKRLANISFADRMEGIKCSEHYLLRFYQSVLLVLLIGGIESIKKKMLY